MKQKIKTWLIHWLGGVTQEESVQSDANSWTIGKVVTLNAIKKYGKSLYGKDPESWCHCMWNYINCEILKIDEATLQH